MTVAAPPIGDHIADRVARAIDYLPPGVPHHPQNIFFRSEDRSVRWSLIPFDVATYVRPEHFDDPELWFEPMPTAEMYEQAQVSFIYAHKHSEEDIEFMERMHHQIAGPKDRLYLIQHGTAEHLKKSVVGIPWIKVV